jgi:hypothetical protein
VCCTADRFLSKFLIKLVLILFAGKIIQPVGGYF